VRVLVGVNVFVRMLMHGILPARRAEHRRTSRGIRAAFRVPPRGCRGRGGNTNLPGRQSSDVADQLA
jgi:hypothetical protein